MKKILAIIAAVVLTMAAMVIPAFATGGGNEPEPCVPQDAWTETIEHPEVTETIHHEAVTETTPAIWANFSPNNEQGPFDGPPTWPTDPRGTWHIHTQGIPGGHVGPDGVYQQGNGNGSWFYRQAEKVVVVEEAYDEVVVVEEAWTEVIEHPAVTCEEEATELSVNFGVTYGCPPNPYFTPWASEGEEYSTTVSELDGRARGYFFEFRVNEGVNAVFAPSDRYETSDDGKYAFGSVLTPTPARCQVPENPDKPENPDTPLNPETPDKPETPDTPETPVSTPQGPSITRTCVGNDLMVKASDAAGNSSTHYVAGACGDEIVKEEGM